MIVSHFSLIGDSRTGDATLHRVCLTNLSKTTAYFQFRYRSTSERVGRKIALSTNIDDVGELHAMTEGSPGYYHSSLVMAPPNVTVRATLYPYSGKPFYPVDGPYKGGPELDMYGVFELGLPAIQEYPWMEKKPQGSVPVPVLVSSSLLNYTPAGGITEEVTLQLASGKARIEVNPEAVVGFLLDPISYVDIKGAAKEQKDSLAPVLGDDKLALAAFLSVLGQTQGHRDRVDRLNRLLSELNIGVSITDHRQTRAEQD